MAHYVVQTIGTKGAKERDLGEGTVGVGQQGQPLCKPGARLEQKPSPALAAPGPFLLDAGQRFGPCTWQHGLPKALGEAGSSWATRGESMGSRARPPAPVLCLACAGSVALGKIVDFLSFHFFTCKMRGEKEGTWQSGEH